MIICQWFAKCANETTTAVDHPVLGLTPCCTRCAKHVGMDPARLLEIEVAE